MGKKKKFEVFDKDKIPQDSLLQSIFYLVKYAKNSGFEFEITHIKSTNEEILLDKTEIISVSKNPIVVKYKNLDDKFTSYTTEELEYIIKLLKWLDIDCFELYNEKNEPLQIKAKWKGQNLFFTLAPRYEQTDDDNNESSSKNQ